MMNLTEYVPDHQYFGWVDFTVFGLTLLFSTFIGVYIGCGKNKQESRVDYLFAGKSMHTVPVAVSLVVSHFSGITLVGVPAEVYMHGTLYWLVNVSSVIVTIIISFVYLPLFYDLQLTSTYEYLEIRFNKSARVMASVLFTISVMLYIPLAVYVPALALSYDASITVSVVPCLKLPENTFQLHVPGIKWGLAQLFPVIRDCVYKILLVIQFITEWPDDWGVHRKLSGLNIHIITTVVSSICIFYTMVGGLKAVVWIDFLQFSVILLSCIVVIALGVINAGGFGAIWEKSMDGGRIQIFEMDPNPLVRISFWNVIIGNVFSWLQYCAVNQGMNQKFLSLPTLKKAKQSLMIFTVGIFIIKTISVYIGLIIYALYADCDPLQTKVVKRSDQLVPYFVVQTAASIPGLSGLFIAGVFCAALRLYLAFTMLKPDVQPHGQFNAIMTAIICGIYCLIHVEIMKTISSMSTILNSVAGTVYEDFIQPCIRIKLSERCVSYVIRLVVILIGVVCVLMVFVVEMFEGILQLAYTMGGVTSGAFLGLFSLGIFFPRANAKGAVAGSIFSLLFMSWMSFGAQNAIASGAMKHEPLPGSVEGCDFNTSYIVQQHPKNTTGTAPDDVFILYRVSFMYYTMIGTFVLIFVGMIVSLLTKEDDPREMNPALYAPFLHKYVAAKRREACRRDPAEKEPLSKIFNPKRSNKAKKAGEKQRKLSDKGQSN